MRVELGRNIKYSKVSFAWSKSLHGLRKNLQQQRLLELCASIIGWNPRESSRDALSLLLPPK